MSEIGRYLLKCDCGLRTTIVGSRDTAGMAAGYHKVGCHTSPEINRIDTNIK